MRLLVQDYLMTKSLEDLKTEHGVNYRIAGGLRGYKISLNYDQITAKDSDPLAQQCRALVMRTVPCRTVVGNQPLGDTVVLGRSFDRFFNLGQEAAASVDLESEETTIFEKLDGTLTVLYFDDIHGEWHIATRSVPEADLPITEWDESLTFRTLFERALKDTLIAWEEKHGEDSSETREMTPHEVWKEWTSCLDRTLTYLFELCTPMNQVLVAHHEYKIVLTGCRETQTGAERWPHNEARSLGVPHVDRFRFGNVEEMLEFVRGRDPHKYEGIVACQETEPGKFLRIKIKNAQYLALSRLKDSVASPRNIMTLILGERLDDALQVMSSDLQKRSLDMQEGVRRLVHDFDVQYSNLLRQVSAGTEHPVGSKEHRKAFAICAKNSGIWFEAAMARYADKCSSGSDFIHKKREDDGSYPSSFLDYMIQKASEALTQ